MSKLNYPKEGVYPNIRNDVERCNDLLSDAISNCAFDIPSDFPYRNYLNGLNTTLNNYRTLNRKIGNRIERIDANFRHLSDNLCASISRITTPKIDKRERLIK